MVDLSGLTTINIGLAAQDDILSFNVTGTGSQIKLKGLRFVQTTGNGNERLEFTASQGGRLEFSDYLAVPRTSAVVADVDSSMTIDRSLFLRGGAITMPTASVLSIGKHWYNETTDEAAFNATQLVISFASPGVHLFEVGGMDVGPINPINNGNFGIGRIEVGLPGVAASLQLLDLFNNGNRGGNLPEALYIFGIGQGTDSEGLQLAGGSTLFLDNLNVYVRENGNWINLNSLFGPGNTVVPYAGGYLHLPGPGAAVVFLTAVASLARRTRRIKFN